MTAFRKWCIGFSERKWGHFVTGIIIVVAVIVVGAEGFVPPGKSLPIWLWIADKVVVSLFVVEAMLKIYGSRTEYFRRGWNIFDFCVTCACMGEVVAVEYFGYDFHIFAVVRMLRLGRICELIYPFRRHAESVVKSFKGLLIVSLEAVIVVFVLSLMGKTLFGHIDPEHWGTIGLAVDSIFFGLFQSGGALSVYRTASQGAGPIMAWVVRGYFAVVVLCGGVFLARIFTVVHRAMDDGDRRDETCN
jgi:voltage-gated sodium channel